MDNTPSSRRQFLAATAKLASASWLAMNWPSVAAAAEKAHAMSMGDMEHGMAPPPPAVLHTLSATEAADVDAISNQIVPGGATPGARACNSVYFIDNALGSFFSAQMPAFHKGLVDFQAAYAAKSGGKPFSQASDAEQIAYLHTVDKTPFFGAVRRLTILGMTAWPKYGGNKDGQGTKLIGVINQHVWAPPFGYYDKDYPGFTPYPGTKPYTA